MLRDKTVVSKLIRRTGLFLFGLLIFTTVIVGLQSSHNQVSALSNSNQLNFQARLLTSSGAVVPDGNYNIDFRLYSSASGAADNVGVTNPSTCSSSCEWEELYAYSGYAGATHYTGTVGPQLTVRDGYVSVYLGDSNSPFPSTINWSIPQYLTMDIDQNGTTASGPITWDGEMVGPSNARIQLTSVPSAFVANQLETNNGGYSGVLGFGALSNNLWLDLPDPTGTSVGSPATICLDNDSQDSYCGYAPQINYGTINPVPSGYGYILNQIGQQTSSNFNISGTGTMANTVATNSLTVGTCLSTCLAPGGSPPTANMITIEDGTNNNVITLNASGTSSSYYLTLPQTAPQANQCLMTSTSSTTQLVYGACNGGPTLALKNTWNAINTSSPTSIAVADNPSAVGDLVVLAVKTSSNVIPSKITVNSNSGGIDNWHSVTNASSTGGVNPSTLELFYGTVYQTGSSTITVNFATSPSPPPYTQIMAMEFASGDGTGTIWTAANGAGSTQSASSTALYPNIASAAAGGLYFGYAYLPGGANTTSGGSTGCAVGYCGYTYYADTNNQTTEAGYTYNTTYNFVTPPTYQAGAAQVSASAYASIGAFFYPTAGSYINDGTTPQNGNFFVVSTSTVQQAGQLEGALGSTADILDLDYQTSVGNADPVVTFGANGNETINTQNSSGSALQVNETSGGGAIATALNVDATNLSIDNASLAQPQTPSVTSPPSGTPTFSQVGGCGPCNTSYQYEITAVGPNGGETLSSPVGTDSGGPAALTSGIYNVVHLPTLTAGTTYNVYRVANGSSATAIGLIGSFTATTTSYLFNDYGQSPILSNIPQTSTGHGNLTSAHGYDYEVIAIDSQGGQSPPSNQASPSVCITGSKSELISWPAVNGAKSYLIYRTPDGASCAAGSENAYFQTNNTFFSDNTLSWTTSGTAGSPNTFTAANQTGFVNILNNNTSNTGSIILGSGGVASASQLYIGGLVSTNPTSSFGSTSTAATGQVEAVEGHYLYVGNSGTSGIQVFDISNPANPQSITTLNTSPLNTSITNLQVSGSYLYTVVGSSPNTNLVIVNISNPASPTITSNTPIVTSSVNTVYQTVLAGSYLYVPEPNQSILQIINVSNPSSISFTNTQAGTATISSPRSIALSGNYVYIGESTTPYSMQVFNVSTPASPTAVYTMAAGTSTYYPQNLTVSGNYLYADGGTKFEIYNISNPATPLMTFENYSTSLNTAATNSMHVYGNYLYMPTASAGGTEVYDVTNPNSAVSVGSIDATTGSNDIVAQGLYLYELSTSGKLNVWALGGGLIQNLQAGSEEAGSLLVDSGATINGFANITGSLTVSGSTALGGNVSVNGQALVQNTSSSAFQVQNGSGANEFTVNTGTTGSATATIGQAGSVTGTLAFANLTNTNLISIAAPTLTNAPSSGYTLTLPTNAPAVGLCLEAGATVATQLAFSACGSASANITWVNEQDSSGTNITSLSYTTSKIGDLIVLNTEMTANSSHVSASGVTDSGSCVTWNTSATKTSTSVSSWNNVEMWIGTVKANACSTTINVSYTASPGVNEIAASEFTASGVGNGTTWGVSNTGATVSSAATVNYPSLTAVYTGQMYFGYSWVATTPGLTTPCSTAYTGFNCSITSFQKNDITYNTNLTAGTTYSSVNVGQSASTNFNAVAALITVFVSSNGINNSTTSQQANFNVQAASSGTVAGVLEGAVGSTADIFDAVNDFSGTSSIGLSVGYNGNTTVNGTATISGVTTVNSNTNLNGVTAINAAGTSALIVAASSGSSPTFSVNTSTNSVGVGTLPPPSGVSALATGTGLGPFGAGSNCINVVGITAYGGMTLPATAAIGYLSGGGGGTVSWTNETGIVSYRVYMSNTTSCAGAGTYYIATYPAVGSTTLVSLSAGSVGVSGVSGAILGNPPTSSNAFYNNLSTSSDNLISTTNSTTALTVSNASGVVGLNVNSSNSSISVGQLATPTAPTSIPNPLATTTFAQSGAGCSGTSTSYTYYITSEQTYGGQSWSTSAVDSSGSTVFSPTCNNTLTIPSYSLGGNTFNIYREAVSGTGAVTTSLGFIGSVYTTGGTTAFVDNGQVATGGTTSIPATSLSNSGGVSLAISTNYYYQVVAVDSNGALSLPSSEALLPTVASAKTLSMSWPAVPGAKGYRVYLGTTSGGENYYWTTNTNYFTDLYTGSLGGVSGIPSYAPTIGFADNLNTGSGTANIVIGTGGSLGTANATSQLFLGGNIPNSPVSSTTITASGTVKNDAPTQEAISGHYLYIADTNSIDIFDVSVAASPVLVSSLTIGINSHGTSGILNNVLALAISGNYLYFYYYASGYGMLNVYNISNPAAPQAVYAPGPSFNWVSGTSDIVDNMIVSGNYLYLAYGSSAAPSSSTAASVEIVNISNPANPAPTSTIATTGTAEGLAVNNNILYFSIAVSSTTAGYLLAYDISNPANPLPLPNNGAPDNNLQNWGLEISGNYLYSTNQGQFNIYNISNVNAVGGISNVGNMVLMSSTNIAGGALSAVSVYGRYAYLSFSTGIYVLDVSNPSAPVQLGEISYTEGGSTSSFADGVVAGRYLYALDLAGGANLLDVIDLGGEYAQNLQAGTTETDTLQVDTNASVNGNTTLSGNLNVSGQAQLNGGVAVAGTSSIQGGLTVGGLEPPGPPTVTAIGTTAARTCGYEIAAVGPTVSQVSAPSIQTQIGNCTNSTMGTSIYNLITWNPVPGASSYNVYLASTTQTSNGRTAATSGYLGNTVTNSTYALSSTSFMDQGQTVGAAVPTGDASGLFTDNGAALFENGVNSTGAFKIETSTGAVIFNANTAGTSGVNPQIVIGLGSAHTDTAAVLLVLDNQAAATTGDPATEVNGAMYYNSYTNTFRCGQAGVWVNCIGGLLGSNTAVSTAITGTTATIGNNINFSTNATIPAGYCSQGRTISLTADGVFSTDSTNVQPITFGVYLGSTLIGVASPSYTPSSSITTQGWKLTYDIICDSVLGTSASVTGEGQVGLFGTTSTATSLSMYTNNTPATVNTNNANILSLGVTYGSIGTNSANNTITTDQFIVAGK